MTALGQRAPLHPLGTHRVLEPLGAMPQTAWKLDNTPVAFSNEILCDVEILNIDSASFKQISDASLGDPQRIGDQIQATVAERGKQHNPVTGSGGMFVGTVCDVGEHLRHTHEIRVGARIASLVSLTLTPLFIERVHRVDATTGRVWIAGKAVLFQTGLWAKLPDDISQDVALAVLDVAGAPAQVARLARPGMTVVVIGADGKSGVLACAQATASGARVIGVAPDAQTESARLLRESGLVSEFVEADACDTLDLAAKVAAVAPDLADLTVNCVNVPGTELASILATKQFGTVYFFSMSTSFTAAALGAEGVGKDVTMIVGNGYAHGHAAIALQTLRDFPDVHAYFQKRYSAAPTRKDQTV